MGEPKLLLDVAGKTVIARVISALREAGVSRTLVVTRPSEAALVLESQRAGAEVLLPPFDPEEMRHSVEWALRDLLEHHSHSGLACSEEIAPPCDGWILVPADHPTLNHKVILQLIAAWSANPQMIAVPVFQGRRGHPTIFPWSTVNEVLALPADQGLNQLLRMNPERVLEVSLTDAQVIEDLDTPADYARLLKSFDSDSLDPAE